MAFRARISLGLIRGQRALQRAVLAAAVLAVCSATAPAETPKLTVVELFTSQGCSSCPPADALLGELAQRHDIVALSEHVDYWDYMGWRDPFASPDFTQRQRDYGRTLGVKLLYTPQIVVQGRRQAPGNDRDAVLSIIAQSAPVSAVDVQASPGDGGRMEIRLGDSSGDVAGPEPATIWLVTYQPHQATDVKRGENRGQQLINHNIVKAFRRIGEWHGKATTVSVEPTALSATDGCAILVQAGAGGAILGAARCEPATPPPGP
jgi:hypothetical protein